MLGAARLPPSGGSGKYLLKGPSKNLLESVANQTQDFIEEGFRDKITKKMFILCNMCTFYPFLGNSPVIFKCLKVLEIK